MTAATSRGLAGNSRTTRDEVARVVGGRGWRGGEKREGTAWRPAVDISERRDAYLVTVEIPGAFRRSLALPSSHVDADKTVASVRDGVLEIVIPKASEPQDTLIPVRATQVTDFLAPGVTRDDRPC